MKPFTALPRSWWALGAPVGAEDVAADQRKPTEEVARLTEALAKTPESIRLLSRRGDARLFLGRFQESVAELNRPVRIRPSH